MNDKLNEMWTALAAYQMQADADGHGKSWALMCSEKTEDAANSAWYAKGDGACAYADAASYAAEAAAAAGDSDTYTVSIKYYAQQAIDHITKAQGETE
jgi:hypothetical protein